MKIGIVGLGLIGGSLAKALKKNTDYEIVGVDADEQTMRMAIEDGVIAEDGDLADCDVVFVCLHPKATVDWAKNADLREGTIVADTCGVKRFIRDNIADCLDQKGLRYVGTHPMAGREVGGYVSSQADLFRDCSWILTWDNATNDEAMTVLDRIVRQIGASSVPRATAEEHDRIIAYTSQMAHVVSNAYVKNKAALEERGFSAGSFQDLTRVARLDPGMWTELFIANADALVSNLDEFITNLERIRDSIKNERAGELHELLADGSEKRIALTDMEERAGTGTRKS